MKIARPSKPDVPFNRKRRPPPQATKLLRYSLLAGVVFMVLLAIVFLPQMFPRQSPVATPVEMQLLNTTGGSRLSVTSVGAFVELSKFRAVFIQDNVTVSILGPPLVGANGSFSFTDTDGDSHLGPGDYFAFACSPRSTYHMEIQQLEEPSTAYSSQPQCLGPGCFVVGRASWSGCPT